MFGENTAHSTVKCVLDPYLGFAFNAKLAPHLLSVLLQDSHGEAKILLRRHEVALKSFQVDEIFERFVVGDALTDVNDRDRKGDIVGATVHVEVAHTEPFVQLAPRAHLLIRLAFLDGKGHKDLCSRHGVFDCSVKQNGKNKRELLFIPINQVEEGLIFLANLLHKG